MTILGAHTVTIVRQAGRDAFGDPEGGTAEISVSGCYVQPRSGTAGASASTEETFQRDTVLIGAVIYMPAGTDLRAADKIRWNGALYQVDGDPSQWDDIHARPHHIEAHLQRAEG